MKLQIISDLHLEFGKMDKLYDKIISTDSDVLVLAGDISSCGNITEDLLAIQEDSNKTIIYVPGNHEYYHSTRKEVDKELRRIKNLNSKIHVLIEGDICIKDIIFIGSTGWWDGSNGEIGLAVKNGLNDFRLIGDLMDEKNRDGITWGEKSAKYLSAKMDFCRKTFPDMKICVVTHHYPHSRSLSRKFANSPLNVCFGNRWEWMIEKYHPEMWIHGHTHDGFNYTVSEYNPEKEYKDLKKTQIICNPQGYPSEGCKLKKGGDKSNMNDYDYYETTENYNYDPQLVVEL